MQKGGLFYDPNEAIDEAFRIYGRETEKLVGIWKGMLGGSFPD